MGSEMVPFERASVSSCRPFMVTFPLSLRVSEILQRLCSSTPLFPTPPLVSPKFPHVPLDVGEWPLGSKREDVGLIVRAISFQDFQYVVVIHQRHKQTDGQRDRQLVVVVGFGPPQPATWSYHAPDCQPTAPVPLVSLVQSAGTLYQITRLFGVI